MEFTIWNRSLPEDVASCEEDIKTQIRDKLEDISEHSAIVARIRQNRLTNYLVNRKCIDLQLSNISICEKEFGLGEQEHGLGLLEYSRAVQYLKITLNIGDEDVSDKKLGDAIFYYVMRGEAIPECAESWMHRLHLHLKQGQGSWNALYSVLVSKEGIFSQVYERLDNNNTALEYFLYKQPMLLLNKQSHYILERLMEHLPYDKLCRILRMTDTYGRSHMFYASGSHIVFVKIFIKHSVDFYQLLSLCDTSGQTALHFNTEWIISLISDFYIPKHKDMCMKLTSIIDSNNQTSKHDNLSSLIRRVKNNEYAMNVDRTNILVIYSDVDRPGADEEALNIYEACKAVFNDNRIQIVKNYCKDKIIEVLKTSSNEPLSSLIVIMASHGSIGTINDCDGNPIKLSAIEEAMCSEFLNGKPKMLITECCQTSEESVNTPPYIPTHDDFCAVMSCASGQAVRGVFFRKLAEQISYSTQDTDIFKIFSDACKEMMNEGRKQTPIIISTLKAELCPTDSWSSFKLDKQGETVPDGQEGVIVDTLLYYMLVLAGLPVIYVGLNFSRVSLLSYFDRVGLNMPNVVRLVGFFGVGVGGVLLYLLLCYCGCLFMIHLYKRVIVPFSVRLFDWTLWFVLPPYRSIINFVYDTSLLDFLLFCTSVLTVMHVITIIAFPRHYCDYVDIKSWDSNELNFLSHLVFLPIYIELAGLCMLICVGVLLYLLLCYCSYFFMIYLYKRVIVPFRVRLFDWALWFELTLYRSIINFEYDSPQELKQVCRALCIVLVLQVKVLTREFPHHYFDYEDIKFWDSNVLNSLSHLVFLPIYIGVGGLGMLITIGGMPLFLLLGYCGYFFMIYLYERVIVPFYARLFDWALWFVLPPYRSIINFVYDSPLDFLLFCTSVLTVMHVITIIAFPRHYFSHLVFLLIYIELAGLCMLNCVGVLLYLVCRFCHNLFIIYLYERVIVPFYVRLFDWAPWFVLPPDRFKINFVYESPLDFLLFHTSALTVNLVTRIRIITLFSDLVFLHFSIDDLIVRLMSESGVIVGQMLCLILCYYGYLFVVYLYKIRITWFVLAPCRVIIYFGYDCFVFLFYSLYLVYYYTLYFVYCSLYFYYFNGLANRLKTSGRKKSERKRVKVSTSYWDDRYCLSSA